MTIDFFATMLLAVSGVTAAGAALELGRVLLRPRRRKVLAARIRRIGLRRFVYEALFKAPPRATWRTRRSPLRMSPAPRQEAAGGLQAAVSQSLAMNTPPGMAMLETKVITFPSTSYAFHKLRAYSEPGGGFPPKKIITYSRDESPTILDRERKALPAPPQLLHGHVREQANASGGVMNGH
jgi:hypothetical protein